MNNNHEVQPVVSKLGWAVWIRQISIGLFALTALIATVSLWGLIRRDESEERQDDCQAEIIGDHALAQSDLNAVGWQVLVAIASAEDETPEQVQEGVNQVNAAIEQVEIARDRRERIDELC